MYKPPEDRSEWNYPRCCLCGKETGTFAVFEEIRGRTLVFCDAKHRDAYKKMAVGMPNCGNGVRKTNKDRGESK
jgi:hypothetical protein